MKEIVEAFKLEMEQLGSELVALVEANRGSKRSLYIKVVKSVDGGAVGQNPRVIKLVE